MFTYIWDRKKERKKERKEKNKRKEEEKLQPIEVAVIVKLDLRLKRIKSKDLNSKGFLKKTINRNLNKEMWQAYIYKAMYIGNL
jgi:hypothetical protein